MFPVKGWSLPASALKAQSALLSPKVTKESKIKSQSNGSTREPNKKSKKRKRDHGRPSGVEVTKENLAELWEKHITGVLNGGLKAQDVKRAANGDKSKPKKGGQKDEQARAATAGRAVDHDRDSVQETKLIASYDNAKREKKKKRKKGLEPEAEESSLVKNTEARSTNSVSSNRVDSSKPDKKRRKKMGSEGGETVPSETVLNEDHVSEPVKPVVPKDLAFQATFSPEDPAKPTSLCTLEATEGTGHISTKEASKAKFERRKAVKEAKRLQRGLLQSKGTIPPERYIQPGVVEAAPKSPLNPLAKKIPQPTVTEAISKTPMKAQKREKNTQLNKGISSTAAEPSSKPIAQPQPNVDSLTPLQKSMRDKLTSARFRHLNQTLYTTPSNSTLSLFSETPSLFDDYHAGFRAQVATWPENPVDKFAADIKLRGRVRVDSQKGAWRREKRGKVDEQKNSNKTTTALETGAAEPLPRTRGACTIADLGCGDAVLARSLQNGIRPLNFKILSYDLAKGTSEGKKFIKIADIANLPLGDGSVDLAIFCLALMGTNWVDFVDEAARVMRWKGELWVAEIKSRFGRVGRGKKEGTTKAKGKKGKEDQQGEDEEVVVEEIDGGEKGKQETDVTAFVEVLRRRGFLLKGQVDMDNKMFVSMQFVKAGPVSKGKVGTVEPLVVKGTGKPRFIEEVEEDVDEGKVLKPCVYKTR